MAFREVSAWISAVALIAVGAWYGSTLMESGGLETRGALLPAVILFIILVVVLHIAAVAISPRTPDRTDERDRVIARQGEAFGQHVLTAALLAITAFALINEAWLYANLAFIGLFAATFATAIAQIWLYRRSA
jgi:hypothetical protein